MTLIGGHESVIKRHLEDFRMTFRLNAARNPVELIENIGYSNKPPTGFFEVEEGAQLVIERVTPWNAKWRVSQASSQHLGGQKLN